MTSPLILVTGATGYIASRLIPRLLEHGYRVRALARQPEKLKGRKWSSQVDMTQGDVTEPSSLASALKGVHTAYYLIHNMAFGRGYTALEIEGARNFVRAAETAGVEHIIYLGGLADTEQNLAPHMHSRIETGKILREGKVPVTEFRAGVIIGSGSISFEMIRFMTEMFPIVPGPLWMKNKSQPIAIQNIVDYLTAALTNPSGHGGVFEIGGPEIYTYSDLMLRYARARGLKRRLMLLPGIPLWFMAFGVDFLTPVPYPIAYALIDGLSADSIVNHPEALKVFPEVELIDFDSATRDALEKTNPKHIEPIWDDGKLGFKILKHEGCFILRSYGIRQQARENESIPYQAQELPESKYHRSNFFGETWIEWNWRHAESVTYIAQTLFFSPRGLPGFFYWYLLLPFRIIYYRGLLGKITR